MNWARIAYNNDPSVVMPSFAGITPWRAPAGQVPEYPRASNDTGAVVPPRTSAAPRTSARGTELGIDALRDELRRLVAEELAQLIKR